MGRSKRKSKATFVRQCPASWPPAKVVAEGRKQHGLSFDMAFVMAVRAEAARKQRRGFASMDPALVAKISRKGGRAAHRAGTAHEFSTKEARAAGSKGGTISARHRRARSNLPEVIDEIVTEVVGAWTIAVGGVASVHAIVNETEKWYLTACAFAVPKGVGVTRGRRRTTCTACLRALSRVED